MPQVSWSSPIESTSDATYRAWWLEIATRLASSSLVRAADTGQMDRSTATRPAANSYGNYEIWRFDDTLQGSAPVFIKFEPGSSNNVATPSLRVTVSSGTNGAGTSTGLVTTAIANHASGILVTNANITNFQSYAVHTAGFFALVFKIGAGVSGLTLFSVLVQRSVNNSGIPTPNAVLFVGCGTGNQNTADAPASLINYVNSTVNNTLVGSDIGFVPSRATSTVIGAGPQAPLHWVMIPEQRPLVGSAAYLLSEVATGSEHDLILVGTTPRHYLAVGNSFRRTAYHGGNVATGSLILWET